MSGFIAHEMSALCDTYPNCLADNQAFACPHPDASVEHYTGQGITLKETLALPSAPHGVVIEIVSSDEAGLSWALPQAQNAVVRLRAKFKDLPVAIVTHGREQFALTQKRQSTHQAEHQIVQSLTQDNQVAVHVRPICWLVRCQPGRFPGLCGCCGCRPGAEQ